MGTAQQKKSTTSSFRLDADLNPLVHEWLHSNPEFNLSRLINASVRKFISEVQTLTPVKVITAKNQKVALATKKMLKRHQDMLDKLK